MISWDSFNKQPSKVDYNPLHLLLPRDHSKSYEFVFIDPIILGDKGKLYSITVANHYTKLVEALTFVNSNTRATSSLMHEYHC